MRAVLGVAERSLRVVSIAACMAAPAVAAHAQNSIPVFPSSVTVRLSTNGTSNANPSIFGTSTQSLTCPQSGIAAKVSSTTDGTGKVLVDNYLNLTLTQGGTTTGPTNICSGGVSESGYNDCFTTGYQAPAAAGQLTGDDPNGMITANGGIGPIDISSMLVPGANTLKFDEVDTGGYLAASSIYVNTNCTAGGTSGGGTITGTPISSTNPTTSQLTQDFTFSGTTGKVVGLVFDLSTAQNAGTLTITDGTTPNAVDEPIDPTTFPDLVSGTSFATSQCLIHLGELYNGLPACKLYTLTCSIGQGTESTGPQCPRTTERNEVIQDVFDFPPLSLPDIVYTSGGTTRIFHQGFGFLETSDVWTGGPCTFDPAADQIFSCPQNLLTQFSGPGAGRGTGTASPVIQSSFISVGPVPEYLTEVHLTPWSANSMWVNSHNITATLLTRPPSLPAGFNGGNLNDFKAAPPYSITYGVAPLAGYPSIPSTEFPVPGDQTILYPGGCPAPGTPPPSVWKPAPVQLHVNADGEYLFHYFATDCAGTQELYFRQQPNGTWYTTFYTAIMFVDTVNPTVVSGPVLSCGDGTPADCIRGEVNNITVYKQNFTVHATYQCSDDFSGVAVCGAKSYGNPVTNPPAVTSHVDTSTKGFFQYSVPVTDAAGNAGPPAVIQYGVQ
jgi:hypothetical protein